MNKLNEVLKKRVEELGGNQAEIARSINFSSQRFGKYLKGRKIPVELLAAWKKRYQEDLHAIAETEHGTNVSRETKREDEPQKNHSADIQYVLLESLKGINKLLDENGKLINDKRKEVESLERVNTWALGQIDKLTSKLGIPKES